MLGAGAAAWLVWNLTKPASASAATAPGSLPSGGFGTPASLPGSSVPASQGPSSSGDPHSNWPLLSSGSQGANVKTWQQVLIQGGFLPNQASSADGIFGPVTTAATKLLQTKAGVVADGIVGPLTRAAARTLGLW